MLIEMVSSWEKAQQFVPKSGIQRSTEDTIIMNIRCRIERRCPPCHCSSPGGRSNSMHGTRTRQDAGFEPASIRQIIAHGTSTPPNDAAKVQPSRRHLRRAIGLRRQQKLPATPALAPSKAAVLLSMASLSSSSHASQPVNVDSRHDCRTSSPVHPDRGSPARQCQNNLSLAANGVDRDRHRADHTASRNHEHEVDLTGDLTVH